MKNLLFICTLLVAPFLFAQQKIRGAESFVLTMPKDYQRAIGINDYAAIQFESVAPKPNSYGFLIFEHKEELKLSDAKLDMIDYTLNSIEPYTTQNGFKYIKKPYVSYEQGFNFAYSEFETNDPESGHIYFLQTVIETKEFVYQILQYCSYENQELMKSDFVSIVNSFKLK